MISRSSVHLEYHTPHVAVAPRVLVSVIQGIDTQPPGPDSEKVPFREVSVPKWTPTRLWQQTKQQSTEQYEPCRASLKQKLGICQEFFPRGMAPETEVDVLALSQEHVTLSKVQAQHVMNGTNTCKVNH